MRPPIPALRPRRGRLTSPVIAAASLALAALAAVVAVAAVLLGAAVALLLYSAPLINSVLTDLPDVSEVADYSDQLFESTVIYSADGVELGELLDEGRRTLLDPDQIPQLVKDATVASEDGSFYDNPGFDLLAVVRAAWLNLQAQDIVSGFSTITQQVVKNSLLSPEQTLERKLREVVLAYQLSQGLAKDEILALYLNQNNYGNLAYGIAAAADTYFGKVVDELTLAETAMLVGIPRSPTTLNPFADLAGATRAQHNVLDLMARNRFITAEDARRAKDEPLIFAKRAAEFGPAPHFFRYVSDYLQERYGSEVATQGWRVRTTLQLEVQQEVEAAARQHIAALLGAGHEAHNSAVVVLDPRSGDILLMIGSVDFGDRDIGGQINMALAPRQPGSAFKPFTYATLLEQGYSPATLFYDTPITIPQFPPAAPYEPRNYDRRFRGPVLLRFALANSLNIPAVKAQQLAGIAETLETARRAGLGIVGGPAEFGPALALGSAEVSLLDLAAAYAAFGQGGLHYLPNPILEITDSRGQTVSDPQRQPPQQVFDQQVAYLMTDILADPITRQAVFGANPNMSIDGHTTAVKTGTTNDFRDALTAGYSTQIAAAVWVGNADNTPMVNVPGSRGALPIWHAAMQVAHDRLAGPPAPFTRPPGIVEVVVDPVSGLLPGPYSPAPRIELFVAGSEPVGQDDIHVPVAIHAPSGKLAEPDTPAEEVVTRIFASLPPEAWDWQLGLAPNSPLAAAPSEYADEFDYLSSADGPHLAYPAAGAYLGDITPVGGRPIGAAAAFGVGNDPAVWLPLTASDDEPSDPARLGMLPVPELPDGPVILRLTTERPDGSQVNIYRTVTIDRVKPEVTLLLGQTGPEAEAGVVELAALASDDQFLRRVDFYVDGHRVASDSLAPFHARWAAHPGPHRFAARAVDAAGNEASSAVADLVFR